MPLKARKKHSKKDDKKSGKIRQNWKKSTKIGKTKRPKELKGTAKKAEKKGQQKKRDKTCDKKTKKMGDKQNVN